MSWIFHFHLMNTSINIHIGTDFLVNYNYKFATDMSPAKTNENILWELAIWNLQYRALCIFSSLVYHVLHILYILIYSYMYIHGLSRSQWLNIYQHPSGYGPLKPKEPLTLSHTSLTSVTWHFSETPRFQHSPALLTPKGKRILSSMIPLKIILHNFPSMELQRQNSGLCS